MKLDAHGGDLLAMASVSKRDPASLLDFSVNVRPEGAPEFLRAALVRANTGLAAYPSPNAEEALAAAARRYGLPAGRFAFGNGSNELIHALARVLKRRGAPCVSIVEPAFSEYALACRLAGLESSPLWGGIGSGADGQPSGDLLAGLAAINIIKAVWQRTRFDDMLTAAGGGFEGAFAQFTSWMQPFGNGGSSFPSGHTAAACSVFILTLACDVCLKWNRRRTLVWALCWAYVAFMALCRLVIGRHYLSDTLAAAFVMLLLYLGMRKTKWYRAGARELTAPGT